MVSLAQEAPKGNAQVGKEIFLADGCYQCHGRVGQGGRGPTLVPMRLPFEAFRIMVRQPSGGGMPPYAQQVLSDQSLADAYAYLLALPGPQDAAQLPDILK